MNGDTLIIAGIGLIIWGGILYAIIRSANDTSERNRLLRQNQRLIAMIAEKLGVEQDRIKKAMDINKK